jgi:hypothetical protein
MKISQDFRLASFTGFLLVSLAYFGDQLSSLI